MFVEIRNGAATVREATDLRNLAVLVGTLDDLTAGLHGFGEPAPGGEHVWLHIGSLKEAGSAEVPAEQRVEWAAGFDGMITYAVSKGWVSDDHAGVRAHVILT